MNWEKKLKEITEAKDLFDLALLMAKKLDEIDGDDNCPGCGGSLFCRCDEHD